MGEIAEVAMDGTLCQQCGVLMLKEGEDPPGHPQTCEECERDGCEGDSD